MNSATMHDKEIPMSLGKFKPDLGDSKKAPIGLKTPIKLRQPSRTETNKNGPIKIKRDPQVQMKGTGMISVSTMDGANSTAKSGKGFISTSKIKVIGGTSGSKVMKRPSSKNSNKERERSSSKPKTRIPLNKIKIAGAEKSKD